MSQQKAALNEQLDQLKALTIRFGAIHEAQSLQLRNWPLLVPGIASAEIKVDVETKTVKMICKSKSKFRATKLARRWIRNIEAWTRNILWNETTLLFEVDDRRIDPMEAEDDGKQQEHPAGDDKPSA